MNRIQSWNIITLFCIIVFGFCIASLIKPDTEYSETENRTLSQKPEAGLSTLLDGSFESDYEDYLTDQFVLRDEWISLKTGVERSLLRTSSNDIFFGKDNYLIEAHTDTFTREQATDNIDFLSRFIQKYQDYFGKEHMTVMIIPNAVDILRDKLPAFASPYDEGEYLALISEAVDKDVLFDARTVLQEHREEELYYRTDHHWKSLAAFYVYQAWALKKGYTVPSEDDFEIVTVTDSFEGTIQSKLGIHTVTDSIELYIDKDDPFYTVEIDKSGEISYSLYDYSALNTKNKYDIFFGGNNALVQIKTKSGTGRKILLIKDSYAHCFVPFMISEFDEIDVLDIRYYNQELSELISEEGYTDLLFLYNAAGFAEDTSLTKLLF